MAKLNILEQLLSNEKQGPRRWKPQGYTLTLGKSQIKEFKEQKLKVH